MKTFIFKIKMPDYDFTVHEDQILKDFMTEPGRLIEFIKSALKNLDFIEIDEVILERKNFYDEINKPILDKVLGFSKEPGNNQADVDEFISKLIKGK